MSAALELLGDWGQAAFGVPDPGAFTIADVAVDPLGQTVYHSNALSIRVYPISVANEVQPRVDALPGSAGIQDFAEGTRVGRIEVGPLGRFLFALNPGQPLQANDDFISIHRIEASGAIVLVERGLLTDEPSDLVVDPSGRFVYVGVASSEQLEGFRIDARTGALAPMGAAVLGQPGAATQYLAIDSSGRFLYIVVNESGTKHIRRYAIDSVSGALSDMATVALLPYTGAILVTGAFD